MFVKAKMLKETMATMKNIAVASDRETCAFAFLGG
jgi:hypothetical protein